MIIVLVGPTASGKTRLAVEVARELAARHTPAEIVNADSMLVYRGMDVGTAKPTPAERGGVRHHLVDVLEVTQTATVADFQLLAREAISDCLGRGVVPVLVGGSALYVRAIVDDFVFPGTDPTVRGRWEAELTAVGPDALHAVLAERAPEVAAGIPAANGRRVVRALEVLELTGEFTSGLPDFRYALPGVVQLGLRVDRAVLDARIAVRVQQMWDAGFVAEVEALSDRGLATGVTASRALGYRQVLRLLAGEIDEPTARQLTVAGTRRFARKQDGWFLRDPRIRWLDGLTATADDVLAGLGAAPPEVSPSRR